MPSNFNLHQLDGNLQDTRYVIYALMPAAFVSDAGATPIWNKDYLASEPKLTADPKQIVTYEINPKAVWSKTAQVRIGGRDEDQRVNGGFRTGPRIACAVATEANARPV